MKKIRSKSKKGFTLVELIVVLVILAILAAMLVPALTGYIRRAREEKEYQTAATMYTAAQSVITDGYGRSNSNILLASGVSSGTISKASSNDAVIDLAGVDATALQDYQFTYDANYIISGGWVEIGNSYYVLSFNATTHAPVWSAQSTVPAAT